MESDYSGGRTLRSAEQVAAAAFALENIGLKALSKHIAARGSELPVTLQADEEMYVNAGLRRLAERSEDRELEPHSQIAQAMLKENERKKMWLLRLLESSQG